MAPNHEAVIGAHSFPNFQPPSFGPIFSSAEAATGGKATAQSCQFHIELHILQMPAQFEDLEVTTPQKLTKKAPKMELQNSTRWH